MEYHEIGEKFEYKGNILEVVGGNGSSETDCVNCALVGNSPCLSNFCTPCNRKDERNVYYKLVKQCKTKDMEHKSETKADEPQLCNDRSNYTRESYIKLKRKRKIESIYDFE